MAHLSDDDGLPMLPAFPKARARAGMEVPSSPPSMPPPPPPNFRRGLQLRNKRTHSFSNSSDMPTFSSDDLENADIHNYQDGPRHKRLVRGPWWRSPTKPQSKGRPIRSGLSRSHVPPSPSLGRGPSSFRQANSKPEPKQDSGVWGLWSETDSLDGFDDSAPAPAAGIVNLFGSCACSSQREAAVLTEVERLVGEHCCSINLSNMSLSKLHSSTLEPLNTLIRKPAPVNDLLFQTPTSAQYHTLRPEIKLFLSGNQLRSLPLGLWNLENLTFLSLRNNQLTEVPSCVVNLPNLQHLNVAANRLRWLPWELLSMMKRPSGEGGGSLEELIMLPNPFVKAGSGSEEYGDRAHLDGLCKRARHVSKAILRDRKRAKWIVGGGAALEAGFVGASAVSLSRPDGVPEPGSWEHEHSQLMSSEAGSSVEELANSRNSLLAVTLEGWEQAEAGGKGRLDQGLLGGRSSVPSLQEMSLRALSAMMASTEPFRTNCPPSTLPAILQSLGLSDYAIPPGLSRPIRKAAHSASELAQLGQRPGHGLAATSTSVPTFSSPASARPPASPFETPVRTTRAGAAQSSPFWATPVPAPSERGGKAPIEMISTQCSVCRSAYVMHGAAWIEYWHVSPREGRWGKGRGGSAAAAAAGIGYEDSPADPFQSAAEAADGEDGSDMDEAEAERMVGSLIPFIRKACCSACARPSTLEGWCERT